MESPHAEYEAALARRSRQLRGLLPAGRAPQEGADVEPEERWRAFIYDELAKRDNLNVDLSWLRDSVMEDSENLPEPEVLATVIASASAA